MPVKKFINAVLACNIAFGIIQTLVLNERFSGWIGASFVAFFIGALIFAVIRFERSNPYRLSLILSLIGSILLWISMLILLSQSQNTVFGWIAGWAVCLGFVLIPVAAIMKFRLDRNL